MPPHFPPSNQTSLGHLMQAKRPASRNALHTPMPTAMATSDTGTLIMEKGSRREKARQPSEDFQPRPLVPRPIV